YRLGKAEKSLYKITKTISMTNMSLTHKTEEPQMSDKTVQSRRDLLKLASVASAATLLSPSLAALAKEAGRSEKTLKAAFSNAGSPVMDLDTLISPLDTIKVHTFLAPDNEFMGASVTQALVNKLGGKGKIIMTQGALGHTGAQGRAKGFKSVIEKFPDMEVLD